MLGGWRDHKKTGERIQLFSSATGSSGRHARRHPALAAKHGSMASQDNTDIASSFAFLWPFLSPEVSPFSYDTPGRASIPRDGDQMQQ